MDFKTLRAVPLFKVFTFDCQVAVNAPKEAFSPGKKHQICMRTVIHSVIFFFIILYQNNGLLCFLYNSVKVKHST